MAPRKRDGAGSSRMGIAHHGERSVFRPMLGLGRTSGYRIGRRCRSLWHALEQCNGVRDSSGLAEQYACVAAPRRFSFKPPRIHPGPHPGRCVNSRFARAAAAQCRSHRHGRGRAIRTPDDLEWLAADQDSSCGVRRTSDRPDPDYRIHVSDRLLEIHDGPFLELRLKGIAGTLIDRPNRIEDRPDSDRLAIRSSNLRRPHSFDRTRGMR